jgi:hypothetical protein
LTRSFPVERRAIKSWQMPMPRRSAAWSTSVPAVQGQDVSRRYWACAVLAQNQHHLVTVLHAEHHALDIEHEVDEVFLHAAPSLCSSRRNLPLNTASRQCVHMHVAPLILRPGLQQCEVRSRVE